MEAGAETDALIERIVKDNHSIAVLGIALHVALKRPAISRVNEALITTQRLWGSDVSRCAQEASIRSSSQIGFWQEHHRKDAVAVEALNTRGVRSADIRTLATLHVLQSDPQAAMRVREAIVGFAGSPDVELEEAMSYPEARDHAYEQARTFAAWGDVDHYRLIDVQDRPDQLAIVMVNPIAEEPAVRERLEEGQNYLRTFSLFHWADRSFKDGRIADAMPLDEAVEAARSLDDDALFESGRDDDGVSLRRGAVAGAAAVVIAFAPDDPAATWASRVLTRAATAREEGGPLWASVGIVSWHHAIFVARAAAADLRRDPGSRVHATKLLSTLIHPLDCVGQEASELLASLWHVAPNVCWVGLGLALDLCIVAPGDIDAGSRHDPENGGEARRRKLDAALARLDGPTEPLAIPPAPWALADAKDHRRVERLSNDEDGPHWRAADGWWKSDRASVVLGGQPVRGILAAGFEDLFVLFCQGMLAWTIERIAPEWVRRSRDIDTADVTEWTHRFADVLGVLVGLVDQQRAEADFIEPICRIADEDACFDLLAPLVRMFICQHVLDAPVAAPMTPAVLECALDRLLAASPFKRDAYRVGEMHGFSMPQLAQWLMFVGVEKASLAHRFANGDWSEIALILPAVDRFVRTAGWAPTVMGDFLTLSERAREHFPAEVFADAILSVLTAGADPGARWRGTMIAASIASRVQEMADRAAPLELALGQKFLRILDILVDQGDRRSAALQIGPAFRDLRIIVTGEQ